MVTIKCESMRLVGWYLTNPKNVASIKCNCPSTGGGKLAYSSTALSFLSSTRACIEFLSFWSTSAIAFLCAFLGRMKRYCAHFLIITLAVSSMGIIGNRKIHILWTHINAVFLLTPSWTGAKFLWHLRLLFVPRLRQRRRRRSLSRRCNGGSKHEGGHIETTPVLVTLLSPDFGKTNSCCCCLLSTLSAHASGSEIIGLLRLHFICSNPCDYQGH